MREADTERHTGCDSTDGKRPEQFDPQTQRVGSWLSEAGRWGDGGSAPGDRLPIGRHNVLDLDKGNGHIIN